MVDISDGKVRKRVNFYVNCWSDSKHASIKFYDILHACTKTIKQGVKNQLAKQRKTEGLDFNIAEFTVIEQEFSAAYEYVDWVSKRTFEEGSKDELHCVLNFGPRLIRKDTEFFSAEACAINYQKFPFPINDGNQPFDVPVDENQPIKSLIHSTVNI